MIRPVPMTVGERVAVRAFLDHIGERGASPTLRDLASRMGRKSVSTAHRMIAGLESRRLVSRGKTPVFSAFCFKGYGPDGRGGFVRVF